MRAVRSTNTRPERMVRSILWASGYRYRVHARDLPGSPDVVLRPRKKAIFVHGCFWHRHQNCKKATDPKTNISYWAPKLLANAARDETNLRRLRALGWDAMVVWQCELGDVASVAKKLCAFLGRPRTIAQRRTPNQA